MCVITLCKQILATRFDELWLLANSGAQAPCLEAALTCPLKRMNFTGDLPVEDENTDQRRMVGGGLSTRRTNEVGGRVERLFAGPPGTRSPKTKTC